MVYRSIVDRLRLRLDSADFVIGSPLPEEKKLVEELGMARMIIHKAIDLLANWGLVARRHDSGTFVAYEDVHHETSSLTSLAGVLHRQGKEAVSQVLAFEVMPAPPAIASLLRVRIDERIHFSWWVCYVDGKPLMLKDSYMPVKLFHSLSLSHLEGSKFNYTEKECGIIISGNHETLMLVLTDKQLARPMSTPGQTPLLRITPFPCSGSGEFLNCFVMFRSASEYQVDYHLRRVQT